MTDRDDQDEKEKEGRGKSGSGKISGTGGAAGGIRLPPTKLKTITESWKHHNAGEAVARLAEFFSELPARASAQMQVSWAVVKEGASQGFTLVTDLVKLGWRLYEHKLNPTRENRERLRLEFGILVAG